MSIKRVFAWAVLVPEHPKRVATASCLNASRIILTDGSLPNSTLRHGRFSVGSLL